LARLIIPLHDHHLSDPEDETEQVILKEPLELRDLIFYDSGAIRAFFMAMRPLCILNPFEAPLSEVSGERMAIRKEGIHGH
jgi:hypothetical protein